MRAISVFSALVLMFVAVAGWAADFWPEGEDLVWEFQRPGYPTASASMTSQLSHYKLGVTDPVYSDNKILTVDDAGNVVVESRIIWYEEMSEPFVQIFDPPLLFLKFPLVIGNSWQSEAGRTVIFCRVIRDEILEVPAGEFAVTLVQVIDLDDASGLAGDYYLNRNIGPVLVPNYGGLVSYNFTVPVAASSWGSVKALYR